MAVKSHSFLVRSLLVVSFFFNIIFILRSIGGETAVRSNSQRFYHRAVSIKEEKNAGLEIETGASTSVPLHEIPIYDISKDSTSSQTPNEPPIFTNPNVDSKQPSTPPVAIRLGQYSQVAQVKLDDEFWTVIEDLSQRDGDLVFQSTKTQERRVFPKYAEAAFYEYDARWPKYAGLPLSRIGLAAPDLLANELLKNGEPNEQQVRFTVPPIGSAKPPRTGYTPPQWTAFLGTVEASDTAPVFGVGNTRSYQPIQYFPEIGDYNQKRFEGHVGGWMPAVRKVLTKSDADEDLPPTDYIESIVFGDVDAKDPFIIQTWHRTTHIKNNTIDRVVYGHSYPSFPPNKPQTAPEEFYRALFRFGDYWTIRLSDMAHVTLPDPSWENIAKFAFAQELMVRPGGNYPKYGAVDRDYAGSEYDGFQDIFTSSLSANLEWGRFAQAWNVIDNYLTLFVSKDGSINMRGPEVGQFGLSLSLLAKYSRYSGETDLIWKHKEKIVGMAKLLTSLHDESLKLSTSHPGYGLIHGWSESDAALHATPQTFWQPYFANSALTARGLRDISQLSIFNEYSADWTSRASTLTSQVVDSITRSIRPGKNATATAYVPALPGTNYTFRESMASQKPSPQAWPHRLYAELLHSGVLPKNLSDAVIDTMRNFGATSMGVVANVDTPSRAGRDILGFISYGYAYSLLLNDRIDEFILFLYSHRYHTHTRGAWKAGEVTEISGGNALFCIPAQLTIPSILRWALVLEHPDNDVLYFGRGIPRAWLATGKEIGVRQAPTRWGRVDFLIQYAGEGVSLGGPKVRAKILFTDRVPKEVEIKLRVPIGVNLTRVTVNGKAAERRENESVIVRLTGRESPLVVEGF